MFVSEVVYLYFGNILDKLFFNHEKIKTLQLLLFLNSIASFHVESIHQPYIIVHIHISQYFSGA